MAGKRLGIWRGMVQGLSQVYEIQIVYTRRNRESDLFRFAIAWFPEVTVISPRLQRRADAPERPIPHIYATGESEPDILCLFDPRADGWSRDQPIADTIIVWTASWLRFYEAWQATGIWHGGGASHDHLVPGAEVGRDAALPLITRETNDRRPDLLNGVSEDVLINQLLWSERLSGPAQSAMALAA